MYRFMIRALISTSVCCPLSAQEIATIGSVQPYSYTSRAATRVGPDAVLVDEHVIRRPGASFLQVGFDYVRLSEESVLEITGLRDGDKQLFDLASWNAAVPHSIYFNGGEVRIRLWAGRGASGDRFAIRSVAVGHGALQNPATLCSADNRVPFTDRRIARLIVQVGTRVGVGTAFLISARNCFATAGHNFRGRTGLVTAQFGVPPSDALGRFVNPPASRQYNWTGTRRFEDSGRGADWGVLTTLPNGTTRLHAGVAQGSYFRFSTSTAGTTRISGYGVDSTPPQRSMTLQTDAGPFVARTGDQIRYAVDTMPGNSGSPVLNSTGFVIGVHTHGDCHDKSYNTGTWQGRAGFAAARRQLCLTPDLECVAVSAPASLINGSTYTMSTTIRNVGTAATELVTNSAIVLSPNATISKSDTVLRFFQTPLLAVTQSVVHSARIRVPTNVAAGTCYIAGFADHDSKIGERSEGNNTKSQRVTCRGSLPNLIVRSVVPSSTQIVPAQPLTIRTEVANTGFGSAGSSTAGLYLSTNTIISTSDRLLVSYGVPALAGGRSNTQTKAWVPPLDLNGGSCWLGAVADRLARVAESDENDNASAAVAMQCVRLPDLVVTEVAVAPGVAWVAGSRTTLTFTVQNRGTVGSAASTATIHLSERRGLSLTDDYLTRSAIPALAPNASVRRTVTLQHPWCYSSGGSFYLGVFADGFRSVRESNEINNGLTNAAARPRAAYTGVGRYMEFLDPRPNNDNGPDFYRTATFRLSAGARARLCVTAPSYSGYWVLPIWSRTSSRFRFDDLSSLSLALPLFAPPIVRVAAGRGETTLTIPRIAGATASADAYLHTVWFRPDLSLFTVGGTDSLLQRLRP